VFYASYNTNRINALAFGFVVFLHMLFCCFLAYVAYVCMQLLLDYSTYQTYLFISYYTINECRRGVSGSDAHAREHEMDCRTVEPLTMNQEASRAIADAVATEDPLLIVGKKRRISQYC